MTLDGYRCPDMQGKQMQLQNSVKGDWNGYSSTFHFAVDTCDNFKEYTKSLTCKSNEEALKLMNYVAVVTKISTEFYSAMTYASDDKEVSSIFTLRRNPLNSSTLMHKDFEVIPEVITFVSGMFYTD